MKAKNDFYKNIVLDLYDMSEYYMLGELPNWIFVHYLESEKNGVDAGAMFGAKGSDAIYSATRKIFDEYKKDKECELIAAFGNKYYLLAECGAGEINFYKLTDAQEIDV